MEGPVARKYPATPAYPGVILGLLLTIKRLCA